MPLSRLADIAVAGVGSYTLIEEAAATARKHGDVIREAGCHRNSRVYEADAFEACRGESRS